MPARSAKGPGEQGWAPGELCSTGRGGTPRKIIERETKREIDRAMSRKRR